MENNPHDSELIDRFGNVTPEVKTELESMLRMWDVDAEELSFKWESYCIQMGIEETKMTLDTARTFKKHVQNILDKEAQAKKRQHQNPTPRAPVMVGSGADMLDQLIGTTPRASSTAMKRKLERSAYETPSKSRPSVPASSPFQTSLKSESHATSLEVGIPFSERRNPGEVLEVLNQQIPKPSLPLSETSTWEGRIRFAFNLDLPTFSYRNMYQKLSEASEIVDDRIDEFAQHIQEFHNIPDDAFGDPSIQSPNEIIAVGKIVSEALGDERTNASSILLESSRMTGAGARTKLNLHKVRSYAIFPGQIVAVRGVNSGGEFVVDDIYEPPRLPIASATEEETTMFSTMLADGPMSIVIASGPYTTDDNLNFEALDALISKFAEKRPDVVILCGPFIDAEHPMIKEGDFETEEEDGTVEDLFRERIAPLLRRLSASLVFLVPSLRDMISKHLSYPQDQFKNKKALGLSANCKLLPNPSLFSLNDITISITTTDPLFHLSAHEISLNPKNVVRPARLAQHLLSQRSVYPLMPPHSSISLDIPHFRLLDLVGATPDVIVLPSKLAPFARVIDGVVAVNPGWLSKPRASGTYVEMVVNRDEVVRDGEERGRRVHERARVEIVRI
ncbi:DNA polymerase alpha, subunit B [Ascodesmis nigricans]|uniref:DNA polymerase alpha subunit B n=1 Tax=Ascodesmis nigricans TaxID=341454 RepID=A0A4V3SJR3_9PEZI|nr:DNA polymerase alpha, subunit B [Ascodesmis nigricans]